MAPRGPFPRPLPVVELVVMCVVAVGLTLASLWQKLPCTLNPAPGVARITQYTQWACFGDAGGLYREHDLISHVFPYISAPTSPGALPNGTAEYPTLTDVWMWLSALPVASSHGFLTVTGLTFVPVVVVAVLSLALVAGRRAWVFAATPPLFLYAAYNWDLLPVTCVAAALFVELALRDRIPTARRAILSGVLLGLGAAFKLYPVMLVAPLAAAYLLDAGAVVTRRVRDAVLHVGSAAVVIALANVPFMLVNPHGWLNVIRFQGTRTIGSNTLAFWYFGLLPWSNSTAPSVQVVLNHTADIATVLGVLVVLVIGVVAGIRRRSMPWVQTSAAMVCMFMVCNKVDSLQYTLWLLPFFVVVRLRSGWIIAYLAADLASFIGWFHSVYIHSTGVIVQTWADQLLAVGVWSHIVLLPVLAFVLLRTPDGAVAGAAAAADERVPRYTDRASRHGAIGSAPYL